MAIPIRVLIVDDSEDDVFLLVRYLTRGGFDLTWQRVDTAQALLKSLQEAVWDIILSDYSMPHFSGIEALRCIRDGKYKTPVILVSGAIGEEIAVEAIKAGAQDYVLKDNLTRLVPSVERSLREAQNREARLKAEASLQESQELLLAETRQRLHELDALNRISARLRSANTSAEILPDFLGEVMQTLNSPHGAVLLVSPDNSKLITIFAKGAVASFQGKQFPLVQEVHDFLFGESDVYTTPDIHAAKLYFDMVPPVSLGPIAAASLHSAEAVIGVLVVGRSRTALEGPDPTYQESDLRLMKTISELGGNALHRAQLFERANQRIRRLSVLHEIDVTISASLSIAITLDLILAQIVTRLNINAADVLIYNQHAHWLEYVTGRGFHTDKVKRTRFRLGQSLPGNAVLDRKTISLVDLQSDPAFMQAHFLESEPFTHYFVIPLIAKGQIKGVLELFHHEPVLADPELREFFESLASQTAMAIDNIEVFEGLKRSNLELTRAYDAVIESWARSLELREKDINGHAQRVTEMTVRLAMAMGVSDSELPHIRRGALLHDVGMIGIPEHILFKNEILDDDDRLKILDHPQISRELLAKINFLVPALDIPTSHHERWDGTGYPQGLKGDQIPSAARIFAVVDVWDALVTDRIYRKGWTREEVTQYLQEQAGKQFDPSVVEIFLRELSRLEIYTGNV
jgi:response regulator RpfG family c-di-GMP phosphodiesterase